MRLSDNFFDHVQEDYFIYLDQLDPDTSPMSYEAFEWIAIREKQEELAEIYANQ
jgi:hypothetical protein